MGFLDRFRNKSEQPELDPLKDLVLGKLRVGYLLDYDLRTWTMTDYNRYEFNDGRCAEVVEPTLCIAPQGFSSLGRLARHRR